MASIHLDHNLPTRLVHELIRLGHVATHARLQGLQRAKDARHLLFAVEREAVLVTNDRDFELLHDAWRSWTVVWAVDRAHCGILLLAAGLDPHYLAVRLDEQLPATERNELYELVTPGYVWEPIPFIA